MISFLSRLPRDFDPNNPKTIILKFFLNLRPTFGALFIWDLIDITILNSLQHKNSDEISTLLHDESLVFGAIFGTTRRVRRHYPAQTRLRTFFEITLDYLVIRSPVPDFRLPLSSVPTKHLTHPQPP